MDPIVIAIYFLYKQYKSVLSRLYNKVKPNQYKHFV